MERVMPAFEIRGVDFVCMPTSDHDRAVKFYGETLGLPKRKQWGSMPATEFQAGNLTIAVMDPSAFGQSAMTPNSVPLALHVDDVAAAQEALEAEGIEFGMQNMDSGVCHQSSFADPDGNPLILHNRYAPGG
ncbi:MAG TPA: VOC family protein [Baekduia sp.]|nr:VOC family protein [Baekduia sp.]